ncbi:MAG: hypothetical protein DI615_01960 [Gardnerella vaginalis]|nr:MAG: hypothetical protein DI615_01960 [Gardnerella vaginalis]PZP11399.1 MAG: hypothetical protein DI614_01960 [Gardnerella vaginalis]
MFIKRIFFTFLFQIRNKFCKFCRKHTPHRETK